ncbi:hypothetical protein [Luedemannella flava]|uniref:hypothetical protein n=1 Tax=Luedemannella flava TaxID=349316 RepID=UPI0031E2BCB4
MIVLDSVGDPNEPDPDAVAAATMARLAAGRRQLRIRILVAGIVTIGLVGAAARALTVEDLIYQPDTPVRDLFAALADRDASRLADLGPCGLNPLCQPGALASGYEPPTDLHINSVTTTGGLRQNRATVAISYQIAGTPQTAIITLERGTGLLRPWQIVDPPGQHLDIRSQHFSSVQLAGAQVPTAVPDRLPASVGVWAPPGRYTVTAPADPLYVASPIQIIASAAGDMQTITVPVTVQPDAVNEITRQVRAQLDACAAIASFDPQVDTPLSCPFDYTPTDYQPFIDSVRWTITRYPEVRLDLAADGAVTVHTTSPGQAQVTYRWTTDIIEPRQWTTATGRTDITVSGGVTEKDAELVWTG